MIKLYKNSKNFKWRGGSGFGVEADIVILYLYSTFDYQRKPKPNQLKYYPSKSEWIRTDTHKYEFSCHVYIYIWCHNGRWGEKIENYFDWYLANEVGHTCTVGTYKLSSSYFLSCVHRLFGFLKSSSLLCILVHASIYDLWTTIVLFYKFEWIEIHYEFKKVLLIEKYYLFMFNFTKFPGI